MVAAFEETLLSHGGDPGAVLYFDGSGPDALPYITLVSARSEADSELSAVVGVYEWNHRPLMFLADGEALDKDGIQRVRRILAMRGDAQYLGLFSRGRLSIFPISLDEREAGQLALEVGNASDRLITIPHLINERPGVASSRGWISDVILRLLIGSLDVLIGEGVSDEDAISLVGRALFVRFLADRDLISSKTIPNYDGPVGEAFDEGPSAIAASKWLDDTFNGDFLPLTDGLFDRLSPQAYGVLGDILRRAPDGQLSLPWQEKWALLNFAHIPVGVLSQAYERYLSRHDPKKQRREGGYYTPRHIADLLVRGTFQAFRREGIAHKARVLDPAAGAGVFLVTAFRQLVQERWRVDGVRPQTSELRSILYGCIKGFDINEAALRFAALGLYLASIELDPEPEPLRKLRFDDLRPRVLEFLGHSAVQGTDTVSQDQLGSLGSKVGKEHRGAYDLVIGNPPWATATKVPNWTEILKHVADIAKDRVGHAIPAPLPNDVLDLPFVWRAMEWARPGGQIAFALHARVLFQSGETMPEARAALFAALDITSIINGTELRNTRVWPEISAPFCLLFARNNVPGVGAGFTFVSPHLDEGLNRAGAWRIDVANSEVVSSDSVQRRPELLKLLFRGGRLDLEVYDRLQKKALPTVMEFWRSTFGEHHGRARFTGNGYQRLRASSRVRKSSTDQLPGVDASYLQGFPEISDADGSIFVEPGNLRKFHQTRIHDPRPVELFQGPLLLVRESPPVSTERIVVVVSDKDLVFNQSFHGYSAASHSDGEILVRYLAILISSDISIWHALVTSGRFGFEREVVEKFVIDRLPIVPFDRLNELDRKEVTRLFDLAANAGLEGARDQINSWVGGLYGLSTTDLATISDTLSFSLPFSRNRLAARCETTASQRDIFRTKLNEELSPWAQRFDRTVRVSEGHCPPLSPWAFVRIQFSKNSVEQKSAPEQPRWMEVLNAADEISATEIIYPDRGGEEIWVGKINQARYWSGSQARLVARAIIWDHLEGLLSPKGAVKN
ncbi:HsdM family class I SAM-dependent methyltransferase [Devosia lacusdianchii]|uniref:HsdM family class I SAM-dependent methyltransferase n=1 Tax=Devosia lacusdianchii TaxID=2917991 RepID=UPI001F05D472|nr:N-6 DNA methylase [Devosia sp. JXJ CY 41]